MDSKKKSVKVPNIYLYYANIMDYFRVIFSAIAFCISRKCPISFLLLYFFSFVLDLYDGKIARAYNQTSKLGGTLDMVTDRISTAGLLCILGSFYLDQAHIFCLLMMLDVGSHWLQTHSSIYLNPKNINHKDLKEKFWLLEFYYHNRPFMGFNCLGAEVFLLLLYIAHFYQNLLENTFFMLFLYFCGFAYCLKQFISILQVFGAADRIKLVDEKEYLEKQGTNKKAQ